MDKAIDLVYADNDLSIIRHTKKIEEQDIRIRELFSLYEETRLIKDSWVTRATILAAVFFVEQLFIYLLFHHMTQKFMDSPVRTA